jgi:hypothetical protein
MPTHTYRHTCTQAEIDAAWRYYNTRIAYKTIETDCEICTFMGVKALKVPRNRGINPFDVAKLHGIELGQRPYMFPRNVSSDYMFFQII